MNSPSDATINHAAQLLADARYAIAFTGAGISTNSGIPDFRSPDCGLWENADPLKVASIYSFRQNPAPFYDWIYPLARLTLAALPNPAHIALADLEAEGLLRSIITQNIDILHTKAGSKTVYELHGSLREATCTHCFTVYPAQPIIERFLADRQVPHCEKCGGVIKPNVILYGEQLPATTLAQARQAAQKADLVLIIGSSLEVAPARDIPLTAVRNGAKLIIINLEPTWADDMADICIHADAAVILPQIMRQLKAKV